MSNTTIAEFINAEQKSGSLGSHSFLWKQKADEYYRSSEFLWIEIVKDFEEMRKATPESIRKLAESGKRYRPDLANPYLLQISLCIENLLKGIILHRRPEWSIGKLNHNVKTHNLTTISKLVGNHYTKEEQEFFKMGHIVIDWFARYPIPSKIENYIKQFSFHFSNVRDTFLSLYKRLGNQLTSESGFPGSQEYCFDPDPTRTNRY